MIAIEATYLRALYNQTSHTQGEDEDRLHDTIFIIFMALVSP